MTGVWCLGWRRHPHVVDQLPNHPDRLDLCDACRARMDRERGGPDAA